MAEHRIMQAGIPTPFTCTNYRFETNIQKGEPHGNSATLGSVFRDPLIQNADGYSLWLEHAIQKDTRDEYYWLMWYDQQGKPTIPMSGIFARCDLEQMAGRLARDFLP
jgi:hypothetical protein